MLTTNYIVKNCMSFDNGICDSQDMFCKNCNDCLLKQVITLCKQSKDSAMRYVNDLHAQGVVTMCDRLLDKFEVEES